MKISTGIEKISLSAEDASLGPYPSLGFVPIYDAELLASLDKTYNSFLNGGFKGIVTIMWSTHCFSSL